MKRLLLAVFLLPLMAFAQPFGEPTRRINWAATAPSACNVSDMYYNTTSNDLWLCTSANTWTISGGTAISSWISYTVAYTATEFKAADTDASVDLFTLPENGIIEAIRIKHSVAFAGTAVTSVVCSVGDASGDTGDDDAYMPPFNVFQTVGATVGGYDGGAYSTTAAEQTVQLHCVCNVDFGSGSATVLTAGSVDVHVKWAVTP